MGILYHVRAKAQDHAWGSTGYALLIMYLTYFLLIKEWDC